MKVRPILFTTSMVESILRGDKSETRRLVKMTDLARHSIDSLPIRCALPEVVFNHARWFDGVNAWNAWCPYGQPGDKLWVRERCWILGTWKRNGTTKKTNKDAWRFVPDYMRKVRFDEPPAEEQCTHLAGPMPGWCIRPSIHMPRWASRLRLDVTYVRCERLQAINDSGAMAEGVTAVDFYPAEGFPLATGYMLGKNDGRTVLHPTPTGAYRTGWENMHGPDSWEHNDWVWVVGFKTDWKGLVDV